MAPPDLADLVLAVVHAVPEPVALRLAATIERQDDLTAASARRRVAAEVAQASQRSTVARFLEGWAAHHVAVPPIAVAYALRTAVRLGLCSAPRTSWSWCGAVSRDDIPSFSILNPQRACRPRLVHSVYWTVPPVMVATT